MDNYKQVSKLVMKQRQLIAISTTADDIDMYLAYSSGFLTGLSLAGTIDRNDVNTYMHTLRQFADQRKKDLGYAARKILSGYGY